MMNFTYIEALEVLKDVPVNKKSKLSNKGSNYDFLYYDYPYYISKGDCITMLMGKSFLYSNKENMIRKLKLKI